MKKHFAIILCALMMAGCTAQEVATPETTTTNIVLPSTPTRTLTPTATPQPSPTATLSYPLTKGTPLPPSTTVITTENVTKLRQLLLWSQNPLGQVAFSPDGTLMLYASSEWLHLYDVKTKVLIAEIDEFIAPPGQENTVAISNDNKRIMLVQNSLVKVIDRNGNDLIEVQTTDGEAALSPDGKTLSALDYCRNRYAILADCQLSLYDIDSAEKFASYPGERLYFTPDSQKIIIQQGNFLYFRQLNGGQIIRHFDPDNYLNELVTWDISPDGSVFIVIHGDSSRQTINAEGKEIYERMPLTIDLVTIEDGKLLAEFVEYAQAVYLSKNERYCAIVDSNKVIVYDLANQERLYDGKIPDQHSFTDIQGVEDDGSLNYAVWWQDIVGSEDPVFYTQNLEIQDNSIHFINASGYSDLQQFCQINEQGSLKCSEEKDSYLASDGNYYRAGADSQKITLFKDQGDTQEQVAQIDWIAQAYNNVSGASILGYSPGKDFLALQIFIGSASSKVLIVDLAKGRIVNSWEWDEVYPIISLMSSSANYMALKIGGRFYGDNERLWEQGIFDFNKGWFVWHGGSLSSYLLRFSPDEKYILEVQRRDIETSVVFVYDILRQRQVAYYEMQREFSGEFGACNIIDAEISADNQMAFYACQDGTISVVELLSGKEIHRWQAFNEPVTEIGLSSENTRLVAGASGFIKAWDVP